MAKKAEGSSRRARREAHQQRQRRQRILIIGLVIGGIIILGGLGFMIRQARAPEVADVVLPESLVTPPGADGKAWGPVDAPVVIEEFSDFQCPVCGRFATSAGRQLQDTYAGTGLVRFEYKDFAFIGQESLRASEAATCALEQDNFWQYHDTLFLNQSGENAGAFSDDKLRTFAAALGLDESAFNTCLGSNRYRNEINDGIVEASDLGVQATPTFRINGELVESLLTFEQLQTIIDSELNVAQ